MDDTQVILDEIYCEFVLPQLTPEYDTSVQFHIGCTLPKPQETAREKQQRIRSERLRRMEEARKKKRKSMKVKTVFKPYKPWRIVPTWWCPSEAAAFCVDLLTGETYSQKKESLEKIGIQTDSCKKLLPVPDSIKEIQKKFLKIKKDAALILEKNQHIRWVLRCFMHKWRLQRLRLHNQEDPITMSIPEKPIFISSLDQRRIYQFDAVSLGRTFHLRLLHHDGPFPNPLQPMNPFTNEPFTLSQCLSVFAQLRKNSIGYWTLDAFQRSGFQIYRYIKAYDKALRLHAMKSIVWDYKDYDGIDMVFDFIEAQHEYH
jgi:hypothetical protein